MEIDQCDDFHDMMNYFSSIHFNFYIFYLKKKKYEIIRCGPWFFFQQEKKNFAVRVCKSYELMKLLIS